MTAFDDMERRDPAAREADLFAHLRLHVARAKAKAPYWRRALADVDPESLVDRAALARLPVLAKSDLIDLQAEAPPLGGLAADEISALGRLFFSPGPISEAQPRGAADPWRMARALYAAGFRPGDVVVNCFSYHLTPAGFMFDAAAQALGCPVIPGGVGQTETQIQAIRRLNAVGYVGTPDFLKILIEKADEAGAPLESLRVALVTGGPLFPEIREAAASRGVRVRQCYGTAELGLVAYETENPSDGMVVDEGAIVEIVRPGTGDPVAPGEVGEVVATTFEPVYPLIRLGTGDLSAVADGPSACGRTNMRIKGWMGRADQTTKVRGMFVHPRQVQRVAAAFPEIARARLEVSGADGRDDMRLICEVPGGAEPSAERIEAIVEALRVECRVRGEVAFVAPGALPNDGKVIADLR